MVIQEAFVYGRPVICSDIGGMREKVTHGKDGLHVAAGNLTAWQSTLFSAASTGGLWDELAANITPPLSYTECAENHVIMLQKLSA